MSNLVGWWPLHEQNGQANDISGNGNDGTVNGATQGVWGRGGLTAYSFDGSSSYVDTGSTSLLNTSGYTIALWVNLNSSGSTQTALSNFNSTTNDVYLHADDGGGSHSYNHDPSGQFTFGDVNTGNWEHIVVTYDGSVLKGYENGSLINTLTSSVNNPDSGANYEIGRRPDNVNHVDGSISDLRIYDRAISPQEIQTLYEWGSGDYTDRTLHDGSDSGAVSRYEFNGDVTDSWGSNDGTDNTSAGFVSGIRGNSKDFDGTDDYVDVGDIGVTENKTFTFSLWVNLDVTGTAQALLSETDTGDADTFVTLQIGGDDIPEVLLRDDTSTSNVAQGGSLTADDWYHVVGTADGSDLKLYLNGVLRDTTSITVGTVTTDDTEIGRAGGALTTNYTNGQIDDVRIYDRALSQAEVSQLYRWGAQGKDLRKEIVKR